MKKNTGHLILIVDDNPVILKLLGSVLSREGCQVIEARSGKQALDILESLIPELILLDIEMPGISGLETCRKIKSESRLSDIPILFVTSSHSQKDIVAGFAAGAQDYIVKPSSKEEILARVRTHLALSLSQKELKESRARYRELSFRDDLTGLYNTRFLYKSLETQLERHPEQPVAVIFIDIDKFKQVVDTHGHLNGSRTIAELAAILKGQLPQKGYGVSYGGDEFVVVLPGCNTEAGAEIAEQLRLAIAGNYFLGSQGLAVCITISSGVASYPDDAFTLVDLLGNADHALFETKRRGRNTVVRFAELEAEHEEFLVADLKE